MVLNENGIIQRSKLAAEEHTKAQAKEEQNLKEASDFISNYGQSKDGDTSSFNKLDIGKKVVGYTSNDLNSWRLYYYDNDYAYIISDTTISNINLYKKNYNGSNDITNNVLRNLNQTWFSQLGSDNYTCDHAKSIAYFMDQSEWGKYTNNIEGALAIGSPTIELLIKSYNASQEVSITMNTVSNDYVDEVWGYDTNSSS